MNQLKVQIENYKNTWKEPGYKKIKMYTLICWLEKIMKYIAGTGSIVILIISFRNLYNIFTLEIKQSSFFMLDASKQAEFTKITEDMGAWIGAFAAFVFLVLIDISLKQFIIPKVSIHGAFFTDKAIVEKPNFRVKETRDVNSDLKSLKLRQIVICFIGIGSIATPTTLISNFAYFSEKTSYFLIFTLGTLLIFQLVKHFILKRIAKEFHYGLELLTTEKDFVRLRTEQQTTTKIGELRSSILLILNKSNAPNDTIKLFMNSINESDRYTLEKLCQNISDPEVQSRISAYVSELIELQRTAA